MRNYTVSVTALHFLLQQVGNIISSRENAKFVIRNTGKVSDSDIQCSKKIMAAIQRVSRRTDTYILSTW